MEDQPQPMSTPATPCLECGTTMRLQETTGPYRYAACRVPDVFLYGVRIWACPNCGETEVEIPSIDRLHQALAHLLVDKGAPLSGGVVHFLREYLAMYRGEFAAILGVTADDVLAWEAGAVMPDALAARLRAQVTLGPDREPFAQPDEKALAVRWTEDGWAEARP